jgi:hypothetical protein
MNDTLPVESLATAFGRLWLNDETTRDLWYNRIDWGNIPEVDELDSKPAHLIQHMDLEPSTSLEPATSLEKPSPAVVVPAFAPGIKTIITRNLPRDITVEQLRCVFEKYGPVRDVYIPRNMDKGSPYFGTIKGFALIKFLKPENSATAYTEQYGRLTIGKNNITVEFAKEDR